MIRYLFIRIQGRMSSMEAPVVPIKLAKNVPISRNSVLTAGVHNSVPRSRMPPETVNSPHSNMMKGI